jgi:Fe-S cluster biogenesis protein NfuA
MSQSPDHSTTHAHVEEQIQELLTLHVHPYVQSHGGELVYAGFSGGVVYVHLEGACSRCSAINLTLRFGIERILRKGCAEVQRVELSDDPRASCLAPEGAAQ